jgi:hypothetical protein
MLVEPRNSLAALSHPPTSRPNRGRVDPRDMDASDTLSSAIAYPQLTSPPLSDPSFESSDRLRCVSGTTWWQVLVDQKQ